MASCTIQGLNWVKNGTTYFPSCSATTGDNIEVDATINVTLGAGESNVNIYVYFIVYYPDGSSHGIYANRGYPITIQGNGTYDILLMSLDGLNTKVTGTYSVASVTVMDSTKSNTLCWKANTDNCSSLSITCSSPKYKCSGTSCISDQCDGTGNFTTNNCNNSCAPTGCTNPKFKCSGTSCISDQCDGSGTYINNTCNNSCNPTGCTNPKFKCVNGICQSDNCDGSGIFTTNTCNNSCISGGGGSGLCGSSACDTTKNFCLVGTCIPQMYIYGGFALAVIAMMMMKGR